MSRPSREARREARRALELRKAEARARLAAARDEAREALRARRAEGRRRRSLRRRLVLLAILILLYLLLRCCDCDPPPVPGPVEPDAAPTPGALLDAAPPPPPVAPPDPPKRRPAPIRVAPTARPDFENPAPRPPDWLAALRLQVAARGPRLARCFEGAERPGALRWSAAVDVPRGSVSDHRFEPVLTGADLSAELRGCLAAALSLPRYTLPADGAPAGPARFDVVIEF